MKEKRVLHVLGNVDDRYIEEMYTADEGKKHYPLKKIWLIAAIVALMVLLMGSAVIVRLALPESPMHDYPLTDGTQIPQENIILTVDDVTSTSMHVTCVIDGIEPGKDAIYILSGGPFTLEKQTENGWEALPANINDPKWDADEVLTEGNLDWYVDWSAVYGILDNGTYRYTATVLEGNVPVSVEFVVAEAGDPDLSDVLQGILGGDYYYIRYTSRTEFGPMDNLTQNERDAVQSETESRYTYEYWKSGEDMMQLIWREDVLWVGMMYKDGVKYYLDYEGDDRTKPIIGWSPWPDMDMNRLTDWISLLTSDFGTLEAQYGADGALECVTRVTHSEKYQDYYNVEATRTEVWEFVQITPAEIAAKFAEQGVDTVREFSWEEDRENMKALDVTFVNTTAQPVKTASEAIDRAMAECTVEHDKIMVYRDSEAGMWKVEFQILYGYQGYQYVYLDDDGITQMISGVGSKVEEWKEFYPDP